MKASLCRECHNCGATTEKALSLVLAPLLLPMAASAGLLLISVAMPVHAGENDPSVTLDPVPQALKVLTSILNWAWKGIEANEVPVKQDSKKQLSYSIWNTLEVFFKDTPM